MPSGDSRIVFLQLPERYGGQNCLVTVDEDATENLRDMVTEEFGPREDWFRWVPTEFADAADEAFRALGSPKVTLDSIWDIFGDLVGLLA